MWIREMDREMDDSVKLIVFLWKEKEYADALAEHLLLRYDFGFVSTDELDEDAEEADLILAEEGWFDEIRKRDDLWNKTIFFMEQKPWEEPFLKKEFPYLVWKYDGFSNIRRRISEAMEALCGVDEMVEEEDMAVFVVGAWDRGDNECWELASELANQIKSNVLYMNLETFTGEDMRSSLELSYSLEDMLYFMLDRMEVEGLNPKNHVRSILDVRNGVCSLPEFQGYNPLLRLDEKQMKTLFSKLCQASDAAAVFIWTGRENLDRCLPLARKATRCIYVKPGDLEQKEKKRWDGMRHWMEGEGSRGVNSGIHMAESWTEAYEMIVGYGRELE